MNQYCLGLSEVDLVQNVINGVEKLLEQDYLIQKPQDSGLTGFAKNMLSNHPTKEVHGNVLSKSDLSAQNAFVRDYNQLQHNLHNVFPNIKIFEIDENTKNITLSPKTTPPIDVVAEDALHLVDCTSEEQYETHYTNENSRSFKISSST